MAELVFNQSLTTLKSPKRMTTTALSALSLLMDGVKAQLILTVSAMSFGFLLKRRKTHCQLTKSIFVDTKWLGWKMMITIVFTNLTNCNEIRVKLLSFFIISKTNVTYKVTRKKEKID